VEEKDKTKSDLSDQIRLLKTGEISESDFFLFLKDFPYKDIGDIKLDLHRTIRRGLPEVIYGQDKNIEQLTKIIENLKNLSENVIITRISMDKYQILNKCFPDLQYHKKAGILTFKKEPEIKFSSPILILSAGSSDEPVAEEAYVTSLYLGNKVDKEYDVGVACISRILDLREKLDNYGVIIVIAGMEGALPSVVAGLTSTPVIAVPTSVGYGANFNGLAALLSMLNACAGGVSVVNIDNGFGAAYQATLINQKISCSQETER
jgi:NCAIR mutase (PurE)-related protein